MRLSILSLFLGLTAGLPISLAQAQTATTPTDAGGVSIVHVTATTMTLQFGTTGTGEGRVVAMAATPGGAPTMLVAADNHFYTGAASYGQGSPLGAGFVVYSNTGHSVVVTSLQPNTYYYITTAEYNVDQPSIAYNTNSTSLSTSTAQAAPLPVELTTFTGAVDSRGMATLHWATASEHNSAYFALERSMDGLTFAEIDRVPAAGTSMQPLAYQWPDPRQLTQRTYYRLRQADHDAAVQYSPVLALAPAPGARQVAVYPVPSTGQPVQLSLQEFADEAVTISVVDAMGRSVLAQRLVLAGGQYLAPLPLPAGLAAGTYILTLTSSGSPIQKRIVVSD